MELLTVKDLVYALGLVAAMLAIVVSASEFENWLRQQARCANPARWVPTPTPRPKVLWSQERGAFTEEQIQQLLADWQ